MVVGGLGIAWIIRIPFGVLRLFVVGPEWHCEDSSLFNICVGFCCLAWGPSIFMAGRAISSIPATSKRYSNMLFRWRIVCFLSAFIALPFALVHDLHNRAAILFGELWYAIQYWPGNQLLFPLATALCGVACCFANRLLFLNSIDHDKQVAVGGSPDAYAIPSTVHGWRPKSRVGYVLFAIFFGALGIHNFYALRIKSAVAQLLLTLFTGIALGGVTGIAFATKWEWWMANGWLVAAIVEPLVILCVWLWSIFEICLVDRDGRGVPFQ